MARSVLNNRGGSRGSGHRSTSQGQNAGSGAPTRSASPPVNPPAGGAALPPVANAVVPTVNVVAPVVPNTAGTGGRGRGRPAGRGRGTTRRGTGTMRRRLAIAVAAAPFVPPPVAVLPAPAAPLAVAPAPAPVPGSTTLPSGVVLAPGVRVAPVVPTPPLAHTTPVVLAAGVRLAPAAPSAPVVLAPGVYLAPTSAPAYGVTPVAHSTPVLAPGVFALPPGVVLAPGVRPAPTTHGGVTLAPGVVPWYPPAPVGGYVAPPPPPPPAPRVAPAPPQSYLTGGAIPVNAVGLGQDGLLNSGDDINFGDAGANLDRALRAVGGNDSNIDMNTSQIALLRDVNASGEAQYDFTEIANTFRGLHVSTVLSSLADQSKLKAVLAEKFKTLMRDSSILAPGFFTRSRMDSDYNEFHLVCEAAPEATETSRFASWMGSVVRFYLRIWCRFHNLSYSAHFAHYQKAHGEGQKQALRIPGFIMFDYIWARYLVHAGPTPSREFRNQGGGGGGGGGNGFGGRGGGGGGKKGGGGSGGNGSRGGGSKGGNKRDREEDGKRTGDGT